MQKALLQPVAIVTNPKGNNTFFLFSFLFSNVFFVSKGGKKKKKRFCFDLSKSCANEDKMVRSSLAIRAWDQMK